MIDIFKEMPRTIKLGWIALLILFVFWFSENPLQSIKIVVFTFLVLTLITIPFWLSILISKIKSLHAVLITSLRHFLDGPQPLIPELGLQASHESKPNVLVSFMTEGRISVMKGARAYRFNQSKYKISFPDIFDFEKNIDLTIDFENKFYSSEVYIIEPASKYLLREKNINTFEYYYTIDDMDEISNVINEGNINVQ